MHEDSTRPPVDGTAFEPAGHDPRDERPQYVMPLVVRLERDAAPQRTDALETAARAVLTLLSDPRSTDPAGEWAAAVAAWQDARIRKVVRRARGAEWRRAEALPGITVTGSAGTTGTTGTGHAAEVRVYPPVPLDAWPRDLARLQVSGTDFGDDEPPAAPEPGAAVIWVNPGIEMTAGKSMAQAGHAAQLGWWRLRQLDPQRATGWAADGFPLRVRTAEAKRWVELAASDDLPMVRDAGFTEVEPGTATAIAEFHRPIPQP